MQHHDKDASTHTRREARRADEHTGHIKQGDLVVGHRDPRGATQRAAEEAETLEPAPDRHPAGKIDR